MFIAKEHRSDFAWALFTQRLSQAVGRSRDKMLGLASD